MTQTAFATLIPDARAFLTQLAAQNSRDWFAAHKDRYDQTLRAPALALLERVAARLEQRLRLPVTPKLFRPQRDMRFSRDKTPYHTHLHLLWSCGTAPDQAAFFFGVEPDHALLGGGWMGFRPEPLTRFRARLDSPEGPALAQRLDALQTQGFRLSRPQLKRTPAPYGADHPQAALLRHTSLTYWRDMPTPPPDLEAALMSGFDTLMPVQDWLLNRGQTC